MPTTTTTRATPAAGRAGGAGAAQRVFSVLGECWGSGLGRGLFMVVCWFGTVLKCSNVQMMLETLGKVTVLVDSLTHCF